MKWSFSASKIFSQCPRKWYFSQKLANSTTKDSLKREAFILNQLQTIWAWRGRLVDTVIQNTIVPKLRNHNLPSEKDLLNEAMKIADSQIEFGKSKKYWLYDIKKSIVGNEYCAFYEIEYDGGLDEANINQAKEDIKISLTNLLSSDFIKYLLKQNNYIVSQRILKFQFGGANIECTPDLIVFFKNNPPLIVDWKVQSITYLDYQMQLGIYGVALFRAIPYKDFPNFSQYQVEDINLIEYQLLKNQQRHYSLNTDDIVEIENYIFQSIMQINRTINDRGYGKLNINHFQTANYPGICARCKFKKLCWKNIPVQKSLFEVF